MIIEKPWGHEEIWAKTDKYVGKVLFIKALNKLSLQYHVEKEETIRVLSGLLLLHYREDLEEENLIFLLMPGDKFHIPPGMIHRFEAATDCEIVEVSTTELDDVVRIEDDYGRA